jgi:excisionase family DNA binding protein
VEGGAVTTTDPYTFDDALSDLERVAVLMRRLAEQAHECATTDDEMPGDAVTDPARPVTVPEGLMTPQEVADMLSIPLGRVYTMAQKGEIPVAFPVGPRLRFDRDEVVAWLRDTPRSRRTRKAES